MDASLPLEGPLYPLSLKSLLASLLKELAQQVPKGKLTIRVALKEGQGKYGLELKDLEITVTCDQVTPIPWTGNWVQNIQSNAKQLKCGGLELLQNRNYLRSLGGSLEVSATQGQIQGFICLLPFTY